MDPARVPTRNRPNWLWGFSFVVLLLPLTLGQSSAGGCGATVTVPNPDSNTGLDETLDETIVDSDGDGYSDDEEINATPGTDPNDPTDNPHNVRDSDGDGCSDFDELNFDNFCDNDAHTSACQTTYYNADFGFGFDLPSDADWLVAGVGPLFSRSWGFTFAGVRMGVSTSVDSSPPIPLEDYVTDLSEYFNEVAGWETLGINAVQLSDGTLGYFVARTMRSRLDDSLMWSYDVYAIAGPFLYNLAVAGQTEDISDVVSDEAARILDSLCIE
jgi:hypothetical protein